jgi:hypothetical protein
MKFQQYVKLVEETLTGGIADNKTIVDILKHHQKLNKNVSKETLELQFNKGLKVEREHSNDPQTQKEIVKDHLMEFPDYYDRLEKMEKE